MMIYTVKGRLFDIAREYRAGLALIGVIVALGWLIEPPTTAQDRQTDFLTSLHTAYVQSGPCGETRVPPSR